MTHHCGPHDGCGQHGDAGARVEPGGDIDGNGITRREVALPAAGIGLALAGMALQTSPLGAQAPTPAPERGRALSSFRLADVRLLDGPFLHAQRRTADYLLSLDADRLLHGFRANAGLTPRAPVYGGWESAPTWADIHCQGHTLGHYLSGCALMHAATGDPRFRRRVDHVVDELAACQKASGSGLLCAFPEGPQLVGAFIAGDKVSGVPWYTMHKVFAGLRDAHQQAGSQRAREVLLRYADWAIVATRPLTDDRFEAMLGTEHGGMNEVFADLFAMTGNADYRRMAERFSHKAVLDPLAREQDHLDGLHANTQIPKIVGFQRVHEVTGDASYGKAAAFFWQTVAQSRSFPTGGHGDGEHFFAVAKAGQHALSAKGSETCGMYNMLKLTGLLFGRQPRADYADFYERVLYNGILASQDPATGMVTYFQGGRPGYMKLYCTPVDSFWCCTGTGMENHAKYGEAIYFHDDRSLVVNLFIPSSLTWRERGATVTQTTSFPERPETRLHWKLARPAALSLRLRHPAWSPSAAVRVNGQAVARSDRPGSYIDVERTWQDGDVVDLALEMRVGAVPLPTDPSVYALTYGPLVLAAALGDEALPAGADIVVNERRYGDYNNTPVAVPRLAGAPEAVAAAVRAGDAPLTFTVPDAAGRPVRLIPYHRIAHERYNSYWNADAPGRA